MNTHTPGPWLVDVYGDVQANGEDVARIATSDGHAAADAHLISAAPDLLALAKKFVAFTHANFFAYPPGTLYELRRIIDKATGETP